MTDFDDDMRAALQPRLDESDAAWVMEVFAPVIAAARRPGRPVVQDWVSELSMMQQSVLLTAVRGPDGLPKYHPTKYVLRWYRRCILLSSFLHQVIDNPVVSDGGSFLGPSVDARCAQCGNVESTHETYIYIEDLKEHPFAAALSFATWVDALNALITAYIQALDEVPHHFQLHLLHAAEIVGYKHPDEQIRRWWQGVYERLCHDMHLWPETAEQLDARLGDTREGWLARGDEATNA